MKELNHSPEWYREHLGDENASPLVHAMLKNDMNFIGADYDSGMTDSERIDTYKEKWDEIKSSGETLRCGGHLQVFRDTQSEIHSVIEREALKEFKLSDQFKVEPAFNEIDGLLSEHNVNAATMRQFLKDFELGKVFTKEPFSTISRLMTEAGLDSREMKDFLRYRSRRIGVETRKRNKAEAVKRKPIPPEERFIDYGQNS